MGFVNGLHGPVTLPETGLIWDRDPLPPQPFPGGPPQLPKLPTLPKPPTPQQAYPGVDFSKLPGAGDSNMLLWAAVAVGTFLLLKKR